MIKQLKQYDVQTTPFIATKSWQLLNTQHEDLILLNSSSFVEEVDLALEFIDYTFGNPEGVLNTSCVIALEQQTLDPVIYEEGVSGSGFFYPTDPQNPNGTYKRLVYQQIQRAFYNDYHNPLKMFGLEKIDFQTSGVQKYLSNYFRIFTLPQKNFGDKIVEGSVVFVDNSFDDNYTVTDDKQSNLIASPNLFSRTQEVYHYENVIVSGSSTWICPDPIISPPDPPTSLAAVAISWSSSFLNWTDSTGETGFYIFRSVDSINYIFVGSTSQYVTYSFDYGLLPTSSYWYKVQAFNPIGTSSFSNVAMITTPDKPDSGMLFTTNQLPYTLGPYDTFEEYGVGTTPSNGGYGWESGWQLRTPRAPDVTIVLAVDTMDTYVSGSNVSGSVGGNGWIGEWGS